MTTPWIQPDAEDVGSNWASMSWAGWPPYGSPEFLRRIDNLGQTLAEFKATARYRNAVVVGLIENDQWTGREFPVGLWGWENGEPLARQLRLRADLLFGELRDLLADAQRRFGRVLYARETADILRGKAAGRALRTGAGVHLTVADVPPPARGRLAPDQADAWDRALPDASGPLVGALAALAVPPICTGPVDRAVFEPDPGRIVVASLTDDVGLRRAAAHWLGTLGWNGHAALSVRAARLVGGALVPLGDGGAALPGTWVDAADARIAGAPPGELARALVEGHEFTVGELVARYGVPAEDAPAPPQWVLAGVAGRFAAGRDLDLALTWELWPEQVLVWLLAMAAAFVPVPEL